jgi:hypothetical protein
VKIKKVFSEFSVEIKKNLERENACGNKKRFS